MDDKIPSHYGPDDPHIEPLSLAEIVVLRRKMYTPTGSLEAVWALFTGCLMGMHHAVRDTEESMVPDAMDWMKSKWDDNDGSYTNPRNFDKIREQFASTDEVFSRLAEYLKTLRESRKDRPTPAP